MKKENMLSFLTKQIEKKLADYEVEVDWQTQNHSIEIVFYLYAENKDKQRIDDVKGTSSEEEIIEFEDSILLYDEKKAVFDIADFLAVIPFDRKKGMERGKLIALIDYLKDILDEGQSDLLDFLTSDAQSFSLHFDSNEFARRTQNLSVDFISYPHY